MALTHTIMVPVLQSVLGNGNILAVQQGGHTSQQTHQQVIQTASWLDTMCRMGFVWNGDVYIPVGGVGSTYGWARYNQDLAKFENVSFHGLADRFIPILDRIGYYAYGRQAWGYALEDIRMSVGSDNRYASDYAVYGQSVVMLLKSATVFALWSYPFTSPPASAGSVLTYMARVCELGGKVYTVNPNNSTQALELYDVTNGYPSLVGTPTTYPPLTFNYHVQSAPSRQCLFKYNNKLWFLLPNSSAGYQKMRLFEINPTTGASVEQNSYLPLGWQGNYAGADGSCFEVRDDITPNEQVFIFWHSVTGGWECYEFQEGSFIAVDSGAEIIFRGAGGVVYDPTAKAAQIKSAADSVPSSYVTTEIETFDKNANGLVDIDPRYRWGFTETPPYPQCTEKSGVGSEGVVNLTTKPAGITALLDLSDDFDDAVIDDELWERVNLSLESGFDRDYGHGYANYVANYTLAEISGALRFGRIGDTATTFLGVGVRSKWKASGAFTVDFTLANPENLTAGASFPTHAMIVLVRTAPNEGYGFLVWRYSSAPAYRVRGAFMSKDSNFVFSTDVTTVVDGAVLRIARDAVNTWSVIFDPNGVLGAPVDITPVGSSYAAPVEIVMGALSSTGFWVAPATPVGSEPGIKDVAVSGAGSVGRYQGGVKHIFAWDHISDLGAGINGAAELYVDTQRT